MATPSGAWHRKPASDASIIFVHGLVSSTESCWGKGDESWPSLVEQEADLKPYGIYTFAYETAIFSGSYTLGDAVDALRTYLDCDMLPTTRRLLFVCHSLGGIVVRKYLVAHEADLHEKQVTNIGLFLVASPSLGSDYANQVGLFAGALGHKQVEALKISDGNPWLRDLDHEFMDLKESRRLPLVGQELVEDKPVLMLGSPVVPPSSAARYFANSLKIAGSDHFTIAKPGNRKALQHVALVRFALKCLSGQCSPNQNDADTESALKTLKAMHDLVHQMYVSSDDIAEAVLQKQGSDVLTRSIHFNVSMIVNNLDALRRSAAERPDLASIDLSEIANTVKAMDNALSMGDDHTLLERAQELLETASGYLNILTGEIDRTAQQLNSAKKTANDSGILRALTAVQDLVRQHSCWQDIDRLCRSMRKILAAGGSDLTSDLKIVIQKMQRSQARQPYELPQSLERAYAELETQLKSGRKPDQEAVKSLALHARDIFFRVDLELRHALDTVVQQIAGTPRLGVGVGVAI